MLFLSYPAQSLVLLSVEAGRRQTLSSFQLCFFPPSVLGAVVTSFSWWLQRLSVWLRPLPPRLLTLPAPDSYLSSPWSGWLAPCWSEQGRWVYEGSLRRGGGGNIQPYLHKEKPYCGELRAVSGPVDSGRLQSSPLTGRQQIACALVGPAWWGQMAFGGAGALQDACVLTAWRQVREMQCYSVVPLLFCTFPSPCSVLNCDPSFVKDVFVWECLCGWVHPQPQFNLSSEGWKKKSDLWKKTLQHQALFVNLISQAFIRRGLLSRRYVRLFNKESGCVWFKEQGDSVSIRAPPGDSPISQVKCSGGGASNKVHTISVIHHRGQIYKQQGVRSAVVWTLLKVEEESLPFSCNRMETTPQPPLDRCLDLGVINKPRSEEQRDNFFSVVQYVVRMEFNHVNVKSAHCREVCLKLLQQWFKDAGWNFLQRDADALGWIWPDLTTENVVYLPPGSCILLILVI